MSSSKGQEQQGKSKIGLLTILLLINICRGGLVNEAVAVVPATARSTGVFQFYASVTGYLDSGFSLDLTMPADVATLQTTLSQNCDFVAPSTATATCSWTKQADGTLLFRVQTVSQAIYYGEDIQFEIASFVNPSSTKPTGAFLAVLYDFDGAVIGETTADVEVHLTATAVDIADTVALSSSSDTVADSSNVELTVRATLQHGLTGGEYLAVVFPYVNADAPRSSDRSPALIADPLSGVKVTPVSGFAASTLEWDESARTLYILLPGGVPAGACQFRISPIRNPISTARLAGFEVKTLTRDLPHSAAGVVEASGSEITLSVFTAHPMTTSEATLDVADPTVQVYSEYRITVALPMPVSARCVFEFSFPTEYYILDDEFEMLFGAGAMGGASVAYNENVLPDRTTITTTSGCPSYVGAAVPFILRFRTLKNNPYAVTASSIQVRLYDSVGNIIAQAADGILQATIVPGAVIMKKPIVPYPSTQVIDITSLPFSLQPQHALAADSQIVITFPTDGGEDGLVLPSECVISGRNALVSTDLVCTISANQVLLSKALRTDYTLDTGVYLEFSIDGVRLPLSTKPLGLVKIELKTMHSDPDHGASYELVDEVEERELLTATQRLLSYAGVSSSSQKVYDLATFTFSLKISAKIPVGGKIKINMSDDVGLGARSRCAGYSAQVVASARCVLDTSAQTITISDPFPTTPYTDTSSTISFQVSDVRNPRSLRPSDYFAFQTEDAEGYEIEQSVNQAFVEMTEPSDFKLATVRPESTIVGAQTTFQFRFYVNVPVAYGDILEILAPDETSAILAATVSKCRGGLNLASSLSCYVKGKQTLLVAMGTRGAQVAAGAPIEVFVSNIACPNSTKASSQFRFKLYDSSNELVATSEGQSFKQLSIKVDTPADVLYSTISQQSQIAGQATTYQFSITIKHPMPAGSKIEIFWPRQMRLDDEKFDCAISSNPESAECEFDDGAADREIMFMNANTGDLPSGSTIYLTINGLINPYTAEPSDSFIITTMTGDRYPFLIDRADSGLIAQSSCDWPCLTCDEKDKAQCTSCSTTSPFNIRHDGECLKFCPFGYYEANLRCIKCHSTCKGCSGSSNTCIACNRGTYLLGATCVSSCPVYSLQLYRQAFCALCESPCETCRGTVDSCTSCDQSSSRPFFWRGQCYPQCPRGRSVNIREDGFCTDCDKNCKTCTGQPDICTSCRSPLKLNRENSTCIESCPPDVSVDTGRTCELCHESCATCSPKDVDHCTSCQPGLKRHVIDNTCLTQCPRGTAQVVTLSGEQKCIPCEEGCLECIGSPNYCTRCDDFTGYNFFKFECIKGSCPSEFKRLSEEKNVCVPEKEVCKYGYAYNDVGLCTLVNVLCEDGNILSESLDMCIPQPGLQLPFLFLIAAAAWTAYVYKTSVPDRSLEVLLPQILLGLTFLWWVSYVTFMGLCADMGFQFLASLNYSSVLFGYLLNLTFTLYILLISRRDDAAFDHWCAYNERTTNIFLFLTAIAQFKAARCFYSKAFGSNKNFNAAFDSKFQSIVEPLFYTSMASFACITIPVMLADIYAIVFVRWDYEMVALGFDNFVLSIMIFVLEILEFLYARAKSRGEQYAEKDAFLPALQKIKKNRATRVSLRNALPAHNLRQDESAIFGNLSKMGGYAGDDSALINILERDPRKSTVVGIPFKPQSEEVQALRKIVDRLESKKRFDHQAQRGDGADDMIWQGQAVPKGRKARVLAMKEAKQRFSSMPPKRRTYIIRDREENKYAPDDSSPPATKNPQEQQETLRGPFDRPLSSTLAPGFDDKKTPNPGKQFLDDNYHKFIGRTREEAVWERQDYFRFMKVLKNQKKDDFDTVADQREIRLNKSFDEDLIRVDRDELGDDLSAYKSQGDVDSHLTYPLRKEDPRLDLDDPRELADLEVFRGKLLSKFHYNNCYAIDAGAAGLASLNQGKVTQTVGVMRDPFESSECSESDELEDACVIEEEEHLLRSSFIARMVDSVVRVGVSPSVSQSSEQISLDEALMTPAEREKAKKRKKKMAQFKRQSEEIERQLSKNTTAEKVASERKVDHPTPLPQIERAPSVPLSPGSRRREKLRAHQKRIESDIEAMGLDEDRIVREEQDRMNEELGKLEELSLRQPSDQEEEQADLLNHSVDENDLHIFSGLKRQKLSKKQKRLKRLEAAYGKKRPRMEILSDSKPFRRQQRVKPLLEQRSQSKGKGQAYEVLFPELAEEERLITQNQSEGMEQSPVRSGRSYSIQLSAEQSRQESRVGAHLRLSGAGASTVASQLLGGSPTHGETGQDKIPKEPSEDMGDLLRGGLEQIQAMRAGRRGTVGEDARGPGHQPDLTEEAALREQDLADLDQEIEDLLKSDMKDEKRSSSPATGMRSPPSLPKRQDFSLPTSEQQKQRKQQQSPPKPKEPKRSPAGHPDRKSATKFDKFEHLIFDNIIEQKVNLDARARANKEREEMLRERAALSPRPFKQIGVPSKIHATEDANKDRRRSGGLHKAGAAMMGGPPQKLNAIKQIYDTTSKMEATPQRVGTASLNQLPRNLMASDKSNPHRMSNVFAKGGADMLSAHSGGSDGVELGQFVPTDRNIRIESKRATVGALGARSSSALGSRGMAIMRHNFVNEPSQSGIDPVASSGLPSESSAQKAQRESITSFGNQQLPQASLSRFYPGITGRMSDTNNSIAPGVDSPGGPARRYTSLDSHSAKRIVSSSKSNLLGKPSDPKTLIIGMRQALTQMTAARQAARMQYAAQADQK